MQHNDDPELWAELKRKEVEYEKRRNKKVQYYESVRHAQTVQIDDIPLPQMSEQPPPPQQHQAPFTNPPNRIPLPEPVPSEIGPSIVPLHTGPPLGSLNGNNALKRPAIEPLMPDDDETEIDINELLGCPPGPPPDLFEMHELDSDYEDNEETVKTMDEKSNEKAASSDIKLPKPTSVQQRILAIAGQKYDDFMKELENVHSKKKEKERSTYLEKVSARKNNDDEDDDSEDDKDDDKTDSDTSDASDDSDRKEEKKDKDKKMNTNARIAPKQNETTMPTSMPPQPIMPMPPVIKLPSGPPPAPMGMPPSMMFRPPPMRPGMPPPGMRMAPGMPPRMRMPPGPPPGMPPARLMHNQHNKPHPMHPHINTLAAAPQLTKDTKGMTTITAKPQIRNLSADVTRFVPSTLRVKREDKKIQKPKQIIPEYTRSQQTETQAKGGTKDDAYMQFMREMQGLL